jgi:Flp pilus assembly protein TadG
MVVTGVESGGVYTQDKLDVTFEVYDNIAVNTVNVDLNGTTTTYTEQQLNSGNGKVLVTVPSSNRAQTLEVYCVDYAGNQTDTSTYNFTVSTNGWITFKARYLSKPAFWIGTGTGVTARAGGSVGIFRFRRRKRLIGK